ncbi:F-box/kelch-repeat protein At3g06240-like [Arachis duranensis]|uniref:F-box/kelch-repeat protein At3g06240-like n=1 Tax=Arachis duranensis TaxID=130453 RepID=A0A6P4DCP0_ARADU|nr:F-box/kelch-repeat protein At3g06240-like [Arachis duranensis]
MEIGNHSNQLPNDIVLRILTKLSVKSLKRFSCVQKSWLNLLENSDFKSVYYENLKSKTAYSSSLLLWREYDDRSDGHIREYDDENDGDDFNDGSDGDDFNDGSDGDNFDVGSDGDNFDDGSVEYVVHHQYDVHLLSGERYENMVTLILPSLFEEYIPGTIADCVNGIICHYEQSNYDVKIGLWNPKTDERKIIPPCVIPVEHMFNPYVSVGFGYDNVNDDYKVIQCVYYVQHTFYYDDYGLSNWQIYSLKSNCWKTLELFDIETHQYSHQGFVRYLNGVWHWRGREYGRGWHNGEDVIVSFNLSSEMFRTTSIAWLQSNYGRLLTGALVVLNESLALISSFAENSRIEIFILGEVGVEESWVKLFTIGPFLKVDLPMQIGNKCDVIFYIRSYNDELASFDVITSKVVHNISIKAGLLEIYCLNKIMDKDKAHLWATNHILRNSAWRAVLSVFQV